MDCLHCGMAFHDSWTEDSLRNSMYEQIFWHATNTTCPACHNVIIKLKKNELVIQPGANPRHRTITEFIFYPRNRFRKPTPQEVPTNIREDYEEACAVLNVSEKASAA